MNKPKRLNAGEITASITACANLMAQSLSDDDLELYAAVFSQLGDTLATISVVREINSAQTTSEHKEPSEKQQPQPQ